MAMRKSTALPSTFVIVAAVGLSACRLVLGTAILGTTAVVGTAYYAGHTVYEGGEAVASGVASAGSSAKDSVQDGYESIVVSRGTLEVRSKHPIEALYPAAEQVLREAGFGEVDGRRDVLAGELHATTASGEPVFVGVRLHDSYSTDVVIRIGDGNLKQSEDLYDRMLAIVEADEEAKP